MTKTPAILCDIDGTLADCNHRRHHLIKNDWKSFFAESAADPPIPAVVKLIQDLGHGPNPILFVSGRPEDYRLPTLKWLQENLYPYPVANCHLYMRPAGDFRPDYIIKKEILDTIRQNYEPFISIDDRTNVVRMWRENGVFCLQCPDQTLSLVPGKTNPFVPVKGECLLTVMVGPAGGGKSTYAEKTFHGGSIIQSDQLRAEICGDFTDQSKNDDVFAAFNDLAITRLKHGLPVVLDATHLRRKDRLASASLAPEGSVVRYVVVDRPLADKLADPGVRPEWLIRKHDQHFHSQLAEILEGDHLSNVVVISEIAYPLGHMKKVRK
jgi:hypothetical protein